MLSAKCCPFRLSLNVLINQGTNTWSHHITCTSTQKSHHNMVHCNNISMVQRDLNSLWPNDATWWHRAESKLVQVMACCLTAPSHYLNQCWQVISGILWHSPETNSRGIIQLLKISICKLGLKNTLVKLFPHLSGANELKSRLIGLCISQGK